MRMSLKPSPLKSPAELTAEPVKAPLAAPGKDGPGNGGGGAGGSTRFKLMNGRRWSLWPGWPGWIRRRQDRHCRRRAAALRGTDQEVVNVGAAEVAPLTSPASATEKPAWSPELHAGEDQARDAPDCPSVVTLIGLVPSRR